MQKLILIINFIPFIAFNAQTASLNSPILYFAYNYNLNNKFTFWDHDYIKPTSKILEFNSVINYGKKQRFKTSITYRQVELNYTTRTTKYFIWPKSSPDAWSADEHTKVNYTTISLDQYYSFSLLRRKKITLNLSLGNGIRIFQKYYVETELNNFEYYPAFIGGGYQKYDEPTIISYNPSNKHSFVRLSCLIDFSLLYKLNRNLGILILLKYDLESFTLSKKTREEYPFTYYNNQNYSAIPMFSTERSMKICLGLSYTFNNKN